MSTLIYDEKSIVSCNRAITKVKADLLVNEVINTLTDFYSGSGVQPDQENGLKERLQLSIEIILHGMY